MFSDCRETYTYFLKVVLGRESIKAVHVNVLWVHCWWTQNYDQINPNATSGKWRHDERKAQNVNILFTKLFFFVIQKVKM